MNRGETIRLVARREIIERTRQRIFRIATLLIAALIAAAILLPKLFDNPTTWKIGVTDLRSEQLATRAQQLLLLGEPDAKVTITKVAVAEANRAVSIGTVDVVITGNTDDVDVPTIVVDNGLAESKRAILSAAVQQERVLTKTAELGLSADEAASLFEPGKLNVAPLKPPTDTSDSQIVFAFGIAVLLFYMIMQFGIAIAQGVVEEKSSRVLELLISRMDTRTFLTGKVIGIGLVGLGQMTFFAMVALVLLRIVDSPALDNASWDLAVVSVLWFVVGFFVYAGLYLIAGAIAGRPEDLQSTTFLAVAVGSLSYVAASVAVGNPAADWVRLASLIPFSAPLLQPMRWAHGTAQAADLLIGLVLALGATAVLIRLAATIYDHNVLNRTKTGMLQTLRHRTTGTTGKTIHR